MVIHLGLDNTFGAMFIGNIAAAVLYGLTCLQTLVYFSKGAKDPLAFKLVIYFLWLLDTVQLVFVTHALYHYLITNFADILVLVSPSWSLLAQVYVSIVGDLIIRMIYGRRIWIITQHNIPLAIIIAVTSLGAFGAGFAFTTKGFFAKTFADLPGISYLMFMALGCVVAADIVIAATLCCALSRSRTAFKRTDTVVNRLMIYSINSCLLTTACAVLCLLTYSIWPTTFIFIAFHFCLSKLLLNSLLAMLNARPKLPCEVSEASVSQIPQVFTHVGPQFRFASPASMDIYALEGVPQKQLEINIQVDEVEQAI